MSEEISIMDLTSREALSEATIDESTASSPSDRDNDAAPPPPLPPNTPLTFPESKELKVEIEDKFTWKIDKISELSEKVYSEPFKIGNYQWKLLLYPNGNEPYIGQAVSLYLAIVPPTTTTSLKDENDQTGAATSETSDWSCCVQMILSFAHISGQGPLISKYTSHRFDVNESDWGFGSFCSLKALCQGDSNTGGYPLLLNNESLVITAQLRIIKDPTGILWHNFINYNSKKVTGHVGLANQGATCYMNSLLQSLYFTNAFRKAIFLIPTTGESPVDNNALALQRIFWRLQHDDSAVSTNELTKAFGWETLESFIQSDVQEFSRVLLDEIESRMKGTETEGTIERLFVGKVKNVIKCLNVPFVSARTENFYDLQLAIKGVSTLEESFENYVKAEMLEGDNKYHAEGFGLQDAKRYVEFEQLPPVLHLHLERYAFDPRVMATVKINDRLEFPLEIDLNKYLAEDSPQRQRGEDQTFVLQSVFVHSGDSHGGHYYVFIRDPRPESGIDHKWLKFDDTKVIPVNEKEAVEDNFGGDPFSMDDSQNNTTNTNGNNNPSPMVITRSMTRIRESRDKYRKFTNAYMLVYIRKGELDSVLCPISEEKDIPAHIGRAIKSEDEAEKRKRAERQQALMTLKVGVITEDHLKDYEGFDLFNLDNHNQRISPMLQLSLQRTDTIATLKARIAEEMKCQTDSIRLWSFHPRRNKTVRLDEPFSHEDEEKTLAYFANRLSQHMTHFVILAQRLLPSSTSSLSLKEVEEEKGTGLITNTTNKINANGGDSIWITFKFYDPEQATLKVVGLFSLIPSATLGSIAPKLCDLVGLPPTAGVALEYYEEIKPGRIDQVKSDRSLADCQLQTGDIICYQLANPILTIEPSMPKVTDYFKNLLETLRVQFKKDDGSILATTHLSFNIQYPKLIDELAKEVECPSTHLRLYLGDETGENPVPIKTTTSSLMEAISPMTPENISTEGITLWCEVTKVPVIELESMKRIKFSLITDLMSENVSDEFHLYIAARDTPRLIQQKLPDRLCSLLPEEHPIRLIETHHNRVIRDYIGDDILAPLGETSEVYIESIPASEHSILIENGNKAISVFHFSREASRTHGRPFRLSLISNEPFSLTKARLLRRLACTDATASSWTYHLVNHGRIRRNLEDSDIIINLLETGDQLGVNRSDPITNRPTGGIERSIKIRSSTPAKQQQSQ